MAFVELDWRVALLAFQNPQDLTPSFLNPVGEGVSIGDKLCSASAQTFVLAAKLFHTGLVLSASKRIQKTQGSHLAGVGTGRV